MFSLTGVIPYNTLEDSVSSQVTQLIHISEGVPQACLSATTQPEQVHLSLTGKPSEMCISWVTWDETESSSVLYGITPVKLKHASEWNL